MSWWEDNEDEKSENDDDSDEKMLTTTDGTLQKIVNGALSMVLASSKNKTIQNRIKTFVHREMLTGNRRHIGTKVRNDLNKYFYISRTTQGGKSEAPVLHTLPLYFTRTPLYFTCTSLVLQKKI
jgi:hypothetical protein